MNTSHADSPTVPDPQTDSPFRVSPLISQPSLTENPEIFSYDRRFTTATIPVSTDTDKPKRGLLIPMFALALLLVLPLAYSYFFHKQEVDDLISRLGNRIANEVAPQSGKIDTRPVPPASVEPTPPTNLPETASESPEPPPATSTAPAPPGDLPDATAESTRSAPGAQAPPANPSPKLREPSSLAPTQNGGEAELEQARQYLRDANQGHQPAAIPLLWAAVGKGNSDAEIELADLYARGKVVPAKNCQQARILLRAAQAHDSAAAERKLAQLPELGCKQ